MKYIPLISIIVPIYNCEKTIERTLLSIVSQLNNNELVLVNDGSTDKSMDTIKPYIEKNNNIKLINQENKGLVLARNIGVANSKGKYILFVDGGDELSENSIKIIEDYIFNYEADYYVVNHKTVTNRKVTESKEDIHYINNVKYLFVGKCPYSICFKIFKREFYSNLNLYKWGATITNAEDLCHSVELMKKTSNGCLIDCCIYVYNKQDDSMSNSSNKHLETLNALDFVYEQIKNDNSLINEFYYLVYSKTLVPILLENNFDMNKQLYDYYQIYNIRKNKYIKYKKLSETLACLCTKSKTINSLTSIIIKKIYG